MSKAERSMRLGLGCMRLSTDPERDEPAALATLAAALEAGVTVLDTAHAYGHDELDLGHNEQLVARAVRAHTAHSSSAPIRVITKCGMRRDDGSWVPDGRAGRILDDARASVAALGDVPIDLLLLHAPDPRTSLATAARALRRAHSDGLARRIGVSNVSRKQLEEVASLAPISAVEVALGAFDDLPIRNGVVSYCLDREIELFAHAPLGGPPRAPRLASDRLLRRLADEAVRGSAIEVFLAYLLAVHPAIVPIVGARRVATVTSLARASELTLGEESLALLDARFPLLGSLRRPVSAPRPGVARAEVVLLMGIPGAGKSRYAEDLVAGGYERLNRDTLGGTLRGIVRRLEERLREGATRIVLDNTYVSRATRSDVLRAAHAHGAAVRCVFFATPLEEAQRNACLRMLACFGQVLEPAAIAARAKEHPAALGPGALFRMARDLEPPAVDEGFVAIDVVPFVRRTRESGAARTGSAIPIAVGDDEAALRHLLRRAVEGPCLLFGWRPGADPRDEALGERLTQAHGHAVEVAWCPHPAGPPICWCRPPLPGLAVSFAHRHGIPLSDLRLLSTD